MFGFRIIETGDGVQVIDRSLSTPYDALTPAQMVDYVEVDVLLDAMDRMARKARTETGRKQKRARGIAYRLACFCGLV